jgi:very-short-patch-repair endonuclease
MANERARELRKSMTPQEVKLWVHLRSWRPRGYHFRRQAPRDGHIVDFVCRRFHLMIEVDGGQHNADAHAASDLRRDRHFEREGFRVLRYWNCDVDGNLEGVLEDIDRELRTRGAHAIPEREE